MNSQPGANPSNSASWFQYACDYLVDAGQRSILFWDILRKRGNVYLEHLSKGQPPVLVFEYDVILDGRTLERPVNYALVRILDRRRLQHMNPQETAAAQSTQDEKEPASDRRHRTSVATRAPKATSRPIVIIDPRAGHGPGIGGSKRDSQIGMALDAGHPVYFMIFFTAPLPDQTLADVRNAHTRFIEEVRRRHPDAPKPAVIGNCQGGWAAALIGAERPDQVGPMVFNGSPLSYWAGVEGANPMRYRGGLLGGVWFTSFLSDLGNGTFDGVHLVANFEDLNPANTFWAKLYNVYANVDAEAKRYLDFEKWWGGFFLMTDKEIHTIVDGLFMGNRLERGEFELEEGKTVDLKNNSNPVVVFASFGDSITPPQQAFKWIVNVYGNVEEIRRRGQVIVVHLHKEIGRLGIFVSAKIARKEHKEIIASFDMLDCLPPGLYEMIIAEDPEEPGEYQVHYVEKTTEALLSMDDGQDDELPFHAAQSVSRINDDLYRMLVAPWVKMAANEWWAEVLRQLHPLRMQRYLLSDLNPWLIPVKMWAGMIKNNHLRKSAAEDNPFCKFQAFFSDSVVAAFNFHRDTRDRFSARFFKAIYESPWMKLFYPIATSDAGAAENRLELLHRQDADHWRHAMTRGGFAEAVIRMILAVMLADRDLSRKEYELTGKLLKTHDRLRQTDRQQLQKIVREQARIMQTDTRQAIETLPRLLPTDEQRRQAMALLMEGINATERPPHPKEQAVLDQITAALSV